MFMYKPIKQLGQNFLMNMDVVKKMVAELGIEEGDLIIEIGPGPGVITRELVKTIEGIPNVKLIAVELDERFFADLSVAFAGKENVQVLNENILDFLPTFKPETKKVKIIGSLPYNITSPIIHKIIKMGTLPVTAIIMVQKEVGEKIIAVKVKRNYLSTFVQTFFDVKSLGVVPRNYFKPAPKVDSIVLKLATKNQFGWDLETIEKYGDYVTYCEQYEKFLHNGFKFPKKMLNKVLSKELLQKTNINGNDRPHNLSVETWMQLFNCVFE